MDQRLLDDLLDWLRIPSISTGGGDPADLERAAAWVVERVQRRRRRGARGRHRGQPAGRGRAARRARGRADRAHLRPLRRAVASATSRRGRRRRSRPTSATGGSTRAARPTTRATSCRCCTSRARRRRRATLPVNVRVLVEGEEEAGGDAVAQWVRADERGADCAIVFDSGMVDERTPAITVGLRGIVMLAPEVRTAERDLHSGVYGGSALNALHALHAMLAAVVPGPDGSLRDELRAGIAPPAQAERESWARLPSGDELLRAVGARPAYPGAGAEYYERNGADTSLEINAIHAGEPRTVVPAVAHASVSQRLAPGQNARRRARHARAPAARGAAARRGARARRPRRASRRSSRPTTPPSRCRRRRSSAPSARRPPSCAPAARSRSWPSSPPATSRPWSAASAWRTTPTTRPTSPSGSSALEQGAAAARRALPGAGDAVS